MLGHGQQKAVKVSGMTETAGGTFCNYNGQLVSQRKG